MQAYLFIHRAIISCISAFFLLGLAGIVYAADTELISELKVKISGRNDQIEVIEQEIVKYEKELGGVLQEKSSLQNAIKTLDISQNRLKADIRITQNRISATTFQIEKLSLEALEKEELIVLQTETLANSIRQINEVENDTFVETLLVYEDLSQLWEEVESLQRFQIQLRQNLKKFKLLKNELEVSRSEREGRRRELVNYEYELGNQEEVIKINKNEKSVLLRETKNEESNYNSLINEKKEARKRFEQELASLESQLQIAIDPDSIPKPRNGIISWPLDDIVVTQEFGETEFAKSGAYSGKGHNGVDFRAAPGTPIRATLNGRVTSIGNTDNVKGCFSYGKWALVEHGNGLSSLYAHLSHISAGIGSQVLTGQVIGYSGSTGYSTGPHLHMSLFASEGVRVVRLGDVKKITNCGPASVPVAPFAAYLNPLEYLP